jgi:putative membrane protein
MKNVIRGGLAVWIAGALALGGISLAQHDAQSGTSGSDSTMSGSSSASRKVDKKLLSRLEKIHADNQAELHLGQIALQNAQSPDVKQLAEQMQSDHQKFDSRLIQTAQNAGATLEGKGYQEARRDAAKEARKLQSKTGKDFDKAFISKTVKDHKKDVQEVKKTAEEAQKANQPELASLLQRAQPAVESHLEHAKQIQQSLEKGE